MKPQLTLFVREYCHLCQQMLGQLQAYAERVTLSIVDIEDDDETEERYGQLIPVLMAGDEEICHYHLNTQRLDAYLAKFS